ncbi:HAD family phosphatase [Vibrio fluvialis]
MPTSKEFPLKEYQAYLFDMDGTLVNSEPLKGQALALACQEYGQTVDHKIYKQVMGENWPTVTGHFFRHTGISPDLAEFNRHFRTHYERLLNEALTLTPGAKNYIAELKRQHKRCAVVSSAATWMVERILLSLDLTDAFDLVITQEHVTQHKPHPEAYLLALKRLDVAAKDALVFEDSTAGIEAGCASGCDVIAIQHEFNRHNDLSRALMSIRDFAALLPQPVEQR